MKNTFLDFELPEEDVRLYAQFTKYVNKVLVRARKDYLEKETNYLNFAGLESMPIDERFDVEDPSATDDLERILNWEMIKSHLRCLTLREAEIITDIFVNRLTHEQCAAHIGTTRANVSILYGRALRKLKKSMEGDGEYGSL